MEGGKFTTEVYMLTTSALSQRQKIRHVATFEYPTVRRTYVDMVGYLNCYLSHPDSRPCRGRFSRKRPPRSFEHSFDTELLTVSRHFQDLHVLHCIPMSIFSTVEERLKSYDSRSVGAPVIRWEAWGPENTRCFLDMQDDYQPVHFGHQVLLGDLMLLDFNQLAINRDLQPITQHCNRIRNDEPTPTKKAYWSLRKGRLGKSQSHSDEDLQVDDMYAQDSDVRIISFPSVISRGEVFDEDVVTTLPYRKTYLKWDRNRIYPQIFFGGERWAAMSRDGPGAGYNAGESYSVFCRRRAPCL
ncbi:hypothetical protein BDY19DRAFT_299698 [Irpex rosettiformis]|uniref:Uncharacterized protein n=1 Tax=Irpex rosettiformis TaxID=378272 RepID=A0ACB8TYJ2_9APHY|nr:hypothetical protein BDY19DRAFT_299698 [Irpex rosettiformis]